MADTARGRTVYQAKPELRRVRERGDHPLSLSELATACGMKKPHLSHIELGRRNASPTASLAIAKALGVKRDAVFYPVVVGAKK